MMMTSVYWITGIGFWIGAVIGVTLTFMERRAIVRGRRATGSWLARGRAQIRHMKRLKWMFLAVPVVAIAAPMFATGQFVYRPADVWGIVRLWMPLRLALGYMDSAAQWAAKWTWTPTGEGRRTPRAG
jgi:hypothetical protein